MGKSYENFMCKKFFHPTAKHNIKKVWMREQELEQEGKEENEAIEQYKRKSSNTQEYVNCISMECSYFIWIIL